MKSVIKGLMLTTAIAVLTAVPAMAQEGDNPFIRGRYTAVNERGQPEFDPVPVRVGTFNVDASLGVAASYNDNIFAAPANEEGDTIIRIQPAVIARSNWSAHELSAGVRVDHEEYLENGDESATDYDAFVNGRLDVTRNFLVYGGVNAGHTTEERYDASSFGLADRAAYDTVGGFVRGQYRQDRIQLEATLGATDDSFDQLVQQVRDNTTTYVNARLSYAFTPDVAMFVQARQADLDFSDNLRDGTRTTIDAGVNFELAAPFRGEIAVGSFQDDRDNPTVEDVDGLSVAANVQWFPTQLTTVTFAANRGAVDSGLLTAVTSVNTAYSVRVDHELLRNVLLYGWVRQENNDYKGSTIDREDDALSAAIGAAWKLNRNARLELEYAARSQDSSGLNEGPDIDQNVVSVGVRVYP